MVIEECSELQKAVCKIHRDDGHITEEHDENLREELVDVLVVCQQMFLALKMDEDEINKRAGAKLERALE
jgi:NTP pyrophosphatase (non-canonical NTP hydrolase)